jgi:hypothetical protein
MHMCSSYLDESWRQDLGDLSFVIHIGQEDAIKEIQWTKPNQ